MTDQEGVEGFSNPIRDIGDLPRLETTDFRSVDPRQLKLERALWLASLVVVGGSLVAALALAASAVLAMVAALLTLGVGGLGVWVITLGHRNRGWLVREHDLSVCRGIIRRQVTTVPFNRVQHAAVDTGPLDRFMGLARLEVFTAGGQRADLTLEGLPHGRAHQLRELVTDRARSAG